VQVEEVNDRGGSGKKGLRERQQGSGVDGIPIKPFREGIEHVVSPTGESSVVGEPLEQVLERVTVCVDRTGQDRNRAPVLDR
jgi:hypothetical protein